MSQISDAEIGQAAELLYNWLQGNNQINRQILYNLPDNVSTFLEALDIVEIHDILMYTCFPQEDSSGLVCDVSDEELKLYGGV